MKRPADVIDINRRARRDVERRPITIVGAAESTPEIDRLIREAIDEQRRREQG